MCVGFGIAGLFLALIGIFPHVVPFSPWGRIIFLALFVGLPSILCRLFVPELPVNFWSSPSLAPANQKFTEWLLAAVMSAFVIGFIFWLNKMGTTPELKFGSIGILAGSCFVVSAWQKPWRSWFLIFGLALVAIGLAFPFLPERAEIPAIGITLALANFTGALILHRQLQDFHANGKAAD
jgi:hypothetical protein